MTQLYLHHEVPIRGKTNVWLTPKYITDALGPFDLDPCAAPEPRPWDTAKTYFTEDDNGLIQGWSGFVWLNPPYGDEVPAWMEKLSQHNNGIALVFARTDTKWLQKSCRKATVLFFIEGRIRFCKPDGSSPKALAGAPSLLVGFGEEAKNRIKASRLKGFLVEVVR